MIKVCCVIKITCGIKVAYHDNKSQFSAAVSATSVQVVPSDYLYSCVLIMFFLFYVFHRAAMFRFFYYVICDVDWSRIKISSTIMATTSRSTNRKLNQCFCLSQNLIPFVNFSFRSEWFKWRTWWKWCRLSNSGIQSQQNFINRSSTNKIANL